MSLKYAVGALAELLSGGPVMTVVKDRPEEGSKFVQVAWFEGSALRKEVLPKDAMKVVAEAPAKPAKPAKDSAPSAE